MQKNIITLLFILLLPVVMVFSDTVQLKNGKILAGKITRLGNSRISLKTEYGKIIIKRSSIRKIQFSAKKDSFYFRDDSKLSTPCFRKKRIITLSFTGGINGGIWDNNDIIMLKAMFHISRMFRLGVQFSRTINYFGAGNHFDFTAGFIQINFGSGTVRPYLYAGIGTISSDVNIGSHYNNGNEVVLTQGLGMNIFLTESFSLDLETFIVTTSDSFYRLSPLSMTAGLSFHF